MSLIEQAAKRLEELRRAGAESAGDGQGARSGAEGERVVADTLPTPEAAVHELAARAGAAGPFLARTGQHEPAAPASTSRPAAVAPRDARRLEINLERLKERGFVTPDAPKSQIADEFRIIKRPIIGNAFGRTGTKVRDGNLVMVTSALPGEGKTFTAVNLAMSLAMELDNTVLLVDGDVAHPDLPKTLGVRNSPGLLDLLTDENPSIEDAVVRTNIETLSILPAGAHHRRATELLASEQMAMLLRQLTMRYPDRMIIFDSPPLLATTESRVLASHMGQIVMVVAADSTRQQAVNLALSTIESCEVVLMMLNKAEKTDVGAYYGYYASDAPR
jgi:protein-tyrosine kinase